MGLCFQGKPWTTYVSLFCLLLLAQAPFTHCLDCYQCSNVRNVSDCHQITLCSDSQLCFTDTFGYGDQTTFNMGCREKSVCAANSVTTTVNPVAIVGRASSQTLDCTQCCGVEACNKHICTTGTYGITQNNTCMDHPDYNCAHVGSVFNVCGDREHAKLVCKKFCGFCNDVDGGWSVWTSWTSCDVTCESGTMSRSRLCDNPVPKHGGSQCHGSANETKTCTLPACPIDGGWTAWDSWNSCSHSCGLGTQARTRQCSSPAPLFGGLQCMGDATEVKGCFLTSCTDGVWSSWSAWSTCSQSCLGGLSTRQRQCNSPGPSTFGHDCVGNNIGYQICNSIPCPDQAINGQWSPWTTWSSCSVTCGGGVKKRTRNCINTNANQNSLSCVGNSMDITVCSIYACPGASLARLIGPTKFEGRLEVFYNGEWGTVCDDSFTDVDAQVVCRMMNLPWTGAIALGSAFYGEGTLPIKLDDVTCSSTDTTLFQCSLNVHDNCAHTEDVGVACYPPLKVRLSDGTSSHNGRVEVSFDGSIWGTVCDDSFTDNSAQVVCRMLGYPTFNARALSQFGNGDGEILLNDVVCTGSEDTLLKCQHSKLASDNCGHSEDVGVVCG